MGAEIRSLCHPGDCDVLCGICPLERLERTSTSVFEGKLRRPGAELLSDTGDVVYILNVAGIGSVWLPIFCTSKQDGGTRLENCSRLVHRRKRRRLVDCV
jgi:hypothetical protein